VFDGLYITGFNKPQAANAILNGKNAINISINAPSLCEYGSTVTKLSSACKRLYTEKIRAFHPP
jgi:hypothetical protein